MHALFSGTIRSRIPNLLRKHVQTRWIASVRDLVTSTGGSIVILEQNQIYSSYNQVLKERSSSYIFIPSSLNLEQSTIPLTSYYTLDLDQQTPSIKVYSELNMHTAFRAIQARLTYEALTQFTSRPFVISESYFPGMNHFATKVRAVESEAPLLTSDYLREQLVWALRS